MAKLEVEIVAPDCLLWRGEARMLGVRTARGELGFLPGHVPFLASLVAGEIVVTQLDGSLLGFEVGGGFVSVENDRIVVLADSAIVIERDVTSKY